MQKVMNLIDVNAPCREVFNTVVNNERRMQLSPLWGLTRLLEVSPNYPKPGSSYRIRFLNDIPFGLAYGTLNVSQSALAGLFQVLSLKMSRADREHLENPVSDVEEGAVQTDVQGTETKAPSEQKYFVQEYEPPYKFSYTLDEDCKTIVTWRFQSIPFGTRINYEEVFCDEKVGGEDFIPAVQNVVREWLANIKRYSELHDGRGRQIIKWFLDRFYLKLRPDQRRVMQMVLFMQAIGLATFLIAVTGWGIASLIF
jgi:hypothetical protein